MQLGWIQNHNHLIYRKEALHSIWITLQYTKIDFHALLRRSPEKILDKKFSP